MIHIYNADQTSYITIFGKGKNASISYEMSTNSEYLGHYDHDKYCIKASFKMNGATMFQYSTTYYMDATACKLICDKITDMMKELRFILDRGINVAVTSGVSDVFIQIVPDPNPPRPDEFPAVPNIVVTFKYWHEDRKEYTETHTVEYIIDKQSAE